MFEELHQQDAQRPASHTEGEPLPDAVGAGRAQRSEPERSDGERSGARPAPTASPPASPPPDDTPIAIDAEESGQPRPADADRDRLAGTSGPPLPVGGTGRPCLSGRGKRGR